MIDFQIIIVGGGALDAPPPATVLRAVQGAGPYILKFKLLDKWGFVGGRFVNRPYDVVR